MITLENTKSCSGKDFRLLFVSQYSTNNQKSFVLAELTTITFGLCETIYRIIYNCKSTFRADTSYEIKQICRPYSLRAETNRKIKKTCVNR